jgi:hypothetical protein
MPTQQVITTTYRIQETRTGLDRILLSIRISMRLALVIEGSASLLVIEGSAVAGSVAGSKVRTAKPKAKVVKVLRKSAVQSKRSTKTARLHTGAKLRSVQITKKRGSEVSPRARQQKELAHKELPRTLSGKRWKHLTWKQVARDARMRIENPNLIDQGKQELCGPAATLNAIASTDPRQYIRLVKEVYQSGTFRGKAIPEGLMERKPTTVQPTDWMMLTALRSVSGRPGQRGQHGVSIHSGSLPFELKSWLRTAGFKDVRSTLNLLSARSYKQIPHINDTMANAEQNVAILFVRGGFSQFSHDPGKAPTTMDTIMTAIPVHYVRLLTPITRSGDNISFSVFDHGKKRDYNITEKEFGRGVVGAITGTR